MTSLETSTSSKAPLERLSYNSEETAILIGCSRMSLWRLEQRGLLVPVRHLRRPVYARAAIERYLSGAAPVEAKQNRSRKGGA